MTPSSSIRLKVLFCTFLPLFGLSAQDNKAVVWRGFQHSWTYNHRINRIGSFVRMQGDTVAVTYCSASGVGADSTYFTNFYSLIEGEDVAFYSGVEPVKLYGKEKQLITKEIEVVVPVPPDFQGKDKYITLLNGFDLQAVGRADKLQLLRLSVEDAWYASALKELHFKLKVAIVVNCQSFECSRFNQKTTYDLQVHYLIIAGNDEDFLATSTVFTKSYPWNRKDEYIAAPEKNLIYGKNRLYSQATLGIKSIAVTLNEAHWTVQYHCNAGPLSYNAESGTMDFALDLFFKEWLPGMKELSARPQFSKLSSKKRGWCVLDMGVSLLQFEHARIEHHKHSGSMYWPGFNASPNDPRARSELRRPFVIKN